MNEDVPILPIIIGALALFYFGYEVDRRRNKLKATFNVFDKQESKISETLERLVKSGELKPYTPCLAE